MPIDMTTLEAALSPLEEVGQGEVTFPVNNTEVTLRILVPDEELASQRYAVQVFEEGSDDDRHTVLAYMDRMRTSVLSYALIRVGDHDFRNEPVVETGEKLPNGKPITVERHVALRQLLLRWSRPILTSMFSKYVEMVGKVEDAAEKAIVFEPSDIDAEIERLEERVKELREQKENEGEGGPSFTDELRAIDEHAEDGLQVAPPPQEPKPRYEGEPLQREDLQAPEQLQHGGRQPILPQETAPPADVPPTKQQRPPAQAAPMQAPPRSDESFVDPNDTDAMNREVALENARLLHLRRQQQAQAAQAASAVVPRGLNREAPHVAAAQVAQEMSAEEEAAFAAAQQRAVTTHQGTLGGVDAFSLNRPEVLVEHGRSNEPRSQVPINSGPDPRRTRNPRFNPPNSRR